MQRILIVRLGSMGDIIHTLPAVATLKRGFPEAEIDWVVEGHWAPAAGAQSVSGPTAPGGDTHLAPTTWPQPALGAPCWGASAGFAAGATIARWTFRALSSRPWRGA